MGRLLVIPLGLVALVIGALAWSGSGTEKRADFTFINRGDIITLDINQMSYMQDFRLTYAIREGLYEPDPVTLRPVPTGAVSSEVSPDQLTWTFHLRPEARWSNGDPVRAKDYIFSWRCMLEQPGEYTYLFEYIKNVSKFRKNVGTADAMPFGQVGIESPDPLTLKVTLQNPCAFFLEFAGFPPFYPRHEASMRAFREFDDDLAIALLERRLDAAHRVDKSLSGFALAKAFCAAAGMPELQGAAVDAAAQFAQLAQRGSVKDFDELDLISLIEAWSGFEPFDKSSQLGSGDLQQVKSAVADMAKGHFVRFTYNPAYTRPPAVVTNGPFNLTRWDFKRRLILDKSPTYWDAGHVMSNRIEMAVNENALTQFLQYERGEVNWISDVDPEIAAELRAKGRTDLRTSPAFGTGFVTFMVDAKLPQDMGGGPNPLADIRIRQALAMAIDKRVIVNQITRMGEMPARTYLPPDGTLPEFLFKPGPYDPAFNDGRPASLYAFKQAAKFLDHIDQPEGPGLPFDLNRAKSLLADAGYPDGKGFPTLSICYNTDSAVRASISQLLQEQWKRNLGVQVEIRGLELKSYQQVTHDHQYAIALAAWYGDYPDVSTFTDKYRSDSGNNESKWVNPAFDKLCDQAAAEPDAGKRMRIFADAEAMIDDQVPIVPLYHYVNTSLFHDAVHGLTVNPRNITMFKPIFVDR